MDLNKIIIVSGLALSMVLSVSAVPTLSVSPSDVDKTGNESLYADQVNSFDMTFTNEDEKDTIYDVSPESSGLDTNYISFSDNSFNIDPNSSKTIQAEVFTEDPIVFNDSMSVVYSYNTSEGMKSDSSKFPEVVFDVETEYEETDVNLTVLESSFEAEFGETVTSTFDLENVGSERAYNVNLSGSDASFERDLFDIPEGDHRLIDYNVTIPFPEGNATNKTNQTYTREISISGENFDSKSFTVEVFVPYKEYNETVIEEQKELVDSLLEIQEYCSREENENVSFCTGQFVKTENKTKIVNKTPVLEANLSEEELESIKNISDKYADRIKKQQKQIDILQENIRQLKESVNGDLSGLNSTQRERYNRLMDEVERQNRLQNETLTEEKKRSSFNRTVFTGVMGILVLSLTGLGAVKGYRKISEEEVDEFVP